MNNGSDKVNAELIIKLFDTLRDTDSQLIRRVEKETDALISMGHNLDKIKSVIDEHAKYSNDTLRDLAVCSEESETKHKEILEIVKNTSKRVWTMIIVVGVAFSLMAVSYMVVRNSVETMINDKIRFSDPEHDKLVEQIKNLQDEVERLHKLQDKGR